MTEKVDNIDKHTCNICNKMYSSYKSLWNHKKSFHDTICNNVIPNNLNNNIMINNTKEYKCTHCNKIFKMRQYRWKHEKTCKIKKENDNKIQKLEETINKLKKENDNNKLKKDNKLNKDNNNKIQQLEETINKLKNEPSINNQLINLIVDKTNTIEELKTKIDENKTNNNSLIEINNNTQLKQNQTLKLNDVIVISRSEDNYINATQLCQAGGKQFNDWFCLNTTEQLLNEAVNETGISISQLIDIKKENNYWIHPDLAIQFAQWISPLFSLQVSKWIRTLSTNENQLLEDKKKEIKMKDNKIKLLEDLYVKKQQRKDYPERNVIYILTTEDNKKKRIYIVGKATKLKNRLSTYNKTSEHQVVYYKSCKSEEDMNIIELMVINKLKEYKEKANRDRFILPIEKDITFFTDIIDKSIEFYL
jgi:hypothetical protein